MSRRERLDVAALDGLGDQFQEPIARLAPPGPGPGHQPPDTTTPAAELPPAAAARDAKAGRAGRQQAGYIPAALNKELMLLAIKNDRKKEDLVEEAVRELLQKYGVPLPQ